MQIVILHHDPSAVDATLYQLIADEGKLLCNLNECLETVNTYDPSVWYEIPKPATAAE